MHERRAGTPGVVDDMLLGGLRPSTQQVLLQLLMYKSVFMGGSFRDLAEREPPEVADALMRIHVESAAEAMGIALALREWDAHPEGDEGMDEAAADARRRFLQDILTLKDGVVDVGVVAAMRAPNDDLRQRLLRLADIDRRHADSLRRILGARTVPEHVQDPPRAGGSAPLGVGVGPSRAGGLSRLIENALDDVRERGAVPALLTLSPDALRHARDEGIVDTDTGRAFGIPVEIDMGWRGECFAVETQERIGYAELISESRGRADET